MLVGWGRLVHSTRGGQTVGDARWQGVLTDLTERMKVSRPVRLLQCATAKAPVVLGWLRPVILVPPSAVAGLTPDQLEAVLAHELAHIRRGDYLVNLAQTMAETLLFYHPAVWWLSARIRMEREHCCDDLAVAAIGDRVGYARTLAMLEEFRGQTVQPVISWGGGTLLARVRRLITPLPSNHRSIPSAVAAAAVLMVAAALVAGLRLSARAAERDPRPAMARSAAAAATQDRADTTPGPGIARGPVISPHSQVQSTGADDPAAGETSGEAGAAPAGARVITSIDVEGNAHIATDEILEVIRHHVGEAMVNGRADEIRSAVADLGWFQSVQASTAEADGGVTVSLQVVENPVVREVRIRGARELGRDDVMSMVRTGPGHVYNARQLAQDAARVEALYASRGFVLALMLAPVMGDDGVLTLMIEEGEVEAIRVEGTTDDRTLAVLSALTTKVGDTYNDAAVARDMERLEREGWFDSVKRRVTVGREAGEVVLTLAVVDRGAARTSPAARGSEQYTVRFVMFEAKRLPGNTTGADIWTHVPKGKELPPLSPDIGAFLAKVKALRPGYDISIPISGAFTCWEDEPGEAEFHGTGGNGDTMVMKAKATILPPPSDVPDLRQALISFTLAQASGASEGQLRVVQRARIHTLVGMDATNSLTTNGDAAIIIFSPVPGGLWTDPLVPDVPVKGP